MLFDSEGACPAVNIGNSVFPGLNSVNGLMLCGYEWGFSKADSERQESETIPRRNVPFVFSNKTVEFGEIANTWRYDQRIITWFDLFGHPLDTSGTGGTFEKSIVQTNWCDSQGKKMIGDYWTKLLDPAQVNNFLFHIQEFRPRIIFFFGTQLIKILQHKSVIEKFIAIMGSIENPVKYQTKPFPGRRFNIGFQTFEKCQIVCFPHPSGSHGLSDAYIKLFAPEISCIIKEYRINRGL